MAFQVSPGVNVSEIDLTTIVPAVATALGGIAGNFEWGPSKKVVLVDSPKRFRETFGEVKNWNYNEWFSATNFLGYSSALQVVRVVGGSTYGGVAAANADNGMTTSDQLIHNEDYRTDSHKGIIARYPGQKGDSLMVTIFPGPGATSYADGAGFTAWKSSATNYYAFFGLDGEGAPESTSNIQALAGGVTTNDQMHILVIDQDGLFNGAKDTILERFENLSVFPEARFENGETRFYKRYINENSKYIYVGGSDTPDDAAQDLQAQTGLTFTQTNYVVNWGTAEASNGTTYRALGFTSQPLAGGAGQTSTAFAVAYPAADPNGYNLFEDVESYDVNLLIAGALTGQQAGYIREIVEARKDCIAFFSAENKNEFDQESDKVTKCQNIKTDVGSSSYCVIDSGYKYQYDPYNDLYRWVPLNADTAGLCARTESQLDAWWSPAGFNRGQIRNVVKLAFNPAKAERDQIYPDGINPIITVPGEGTILYGDRTALSRPSAFDRINVRRLFIVIEKAIATASKFSLFEFNDATTRGRFVNLVTPYLEDVRARRGVVDFKVVCDTTNNTPERIDRNEFWADIYIKPNRSINFIQLNFIATRTDSSFSELGA
jgi:hypothetical protein